MGGEPEAAAPARPGATTRVPADLTSDPWSSVAEPSAPAATRHASWWRPIAAMALGASGLVGAAGTAHQAVVIVALAALIAIVVFAAPRSAPAAVTAVTAIALAAVASRWSIGGRQLALVIAGTVTACGALGGWARWRGVASGTWRSLPLAVAPLVAAQIIALREGADGTITALVVLAAAVVAVDFVLPASSHRAEQAFQHGIRVLVGAVAAIVVFPVVLVFLYVPGMIARIVRAASPSAANRSDAWVPYGVTPHDVQLDARRPFASTPRPVRMRRHLTGLAFLAVVALITGIVIVRSHRSADDPKVTGLLTANVAHRADPTPAGSAASDAQHPFAGELAAPYSSLPAYRDVPWADALQREDGTSEPDVRGTYVNVHGHIRASLPPPRCDCKQLEVWFTGGSATFGVGQRDAHTIASQLVRIARSAGLAIDMKNLGRSGGVLFTEVQDIRARLETEPPPDLIIFFDGFNDALFSTAFRFTAGQGTDHEAKRDAAGAVEYIDAHPEPYLRSRVGPAAATDALDLYRGLRTQMLDLARSKGIATAWFFQPDAFTSELQLEGYESISNISPAEFADSPLADALQKMATSLEPEGVVNLRPLFAHYPEPVFLGIVHQNEEGAAITAETIYDHLADDLARLAS